MFSALWKFIGTDNFWFLVLIAFCGWAAFFSPSDPIIGLTNTFVILALVIIWHLARIVGALESKGEDK